jgi:phosphoglycolate phosphatase
MLQEELGAESRETLLVGDSAVDLRTARNAGVPCCLVRYGLGSWNREEGEPDFVVGDLRELTSLLPPAGRC